MKNPIICISCGTENPAYQLTCKSCKSYLRERVVNLDLWNLLGLMLHSPSEAFSLIIRAEHKNFIFFLLIFASIKFAINSSYLFLLINNDDPDISNFFLKILILLAASGILIYLFSIASSLIFKAAGWMTRAKDFFSVLIYSFIPHVYALVVLFVIELIVFGGYIFSSNPSPFLFKPALAWTLSAFEAAAILWAVALSFIALNSVLKDKLFAFIAGLIFNLVIFLTWFSASFYLFK